MNVQSILWFCAAVSLSSPALSEDCYKFLARGAEYRACKARENDARIGKYFCYVSQTAGIQFQTNKDENPNPYVGKIRLITDKFFIEIKRNPNSFLCAGSAVTKSDCAEMDGEDYLFESKSDNAIDAGTSYGTYAFNSAAGSFKLYGNLKFVSFTTGTSSYVSIGACERIN